MNDLINEHKLLASVALIVIAICLRWVMGWYVGRLPKSESELPRRWMNATRNALTVIIVVGLVVIWLSELRFVALSIATFTVALIFATREFIQCLMGAIYQTSTRVFTIGDWVSIGPHCGEVASSDWLTTKLLEVDQASASYAYTGRTIVVPNNQLVSQPVYNLNFMRRYLAHAFTIVRDPDHVDVFKAKQHILAKAEQYCEPFREVAERYNAMLQKRLGVQLAGPGASVRITTNNLGKNEFTISIFCPTPEAVEIEQALTQDFMAYWYAEVEQNVLAKEARKAQRQKQEEEQQAQSN